MQYDDGYYTNNPEKGAVAASSYSEKITGELWRYVNQDNKCKRYNDSSKLNNCTIDKILRQWRVPLVEQDEAVSEANVYANASADAKHVYLTTQAVAFNPSSKSLIKCYRRRDGHVVWQKEMEEYSGIAGDNSRSAPAIWRNYLFFASSIGQPQTWANDVGPVMLGPNPAPSSGRPIRMYCVNKYNGELVWEKELGQTAVNINSPDNYLTITQSPIVFPIMKKNHLIQYVVAVGISSLQTFLPWLATLDGQVLGQRFDFQMTDRGRVVLLDVCSGDLLKEVFTVPPLYQAGDLLSQKSLLPHKDTFNIRHVVTAADLAPGGDLNPVTAPFAGVGRITYVLSTGDIVPAPLNQVEVVDATNNLFLLAAGEVVPAVLDQVVVTLVAETTEGSSLITINGVQILTDDPAAGLVSNKLPVRISKFLRVGDVLSANDAYQSNYYSASVWGNSIAVQSKEVVVKGRKCQVANKIIFGTGQLGFLPYDETEFFDDPQYNYIDQQYIIAQAQQNYRENGSLHNYFLIWDAYRRYEETIQYRLKQRLSVRGEHAFKCALIAVSVTAKKFGRRCWVIKTNNYDYWHLGLINGIRSSIAAGISSAAGYYERPIGPDGDFAQGVYLYEHKGCQLMVSIPKTGFLQVHDISGAEPNLLYRKLIGNADVVGVSAYGSTVSGNIFSTIVTQAYSNLTRNVGLPSPINFPEPLRWYVEPDQYYEPNQSFAVGFDLHCLLFVWNRAVILQQQPLDDYIKNPFGQTVYELCHDDNNYCEHIDDVVYQATLAPIASSQHFILLPSAAGDLQFVDKKTGETKNLVKLDGHAGNSSPIVLDNEVYFAFGRNRDSAYGLNYVAAQFLYKIALPKYVK